MLQLLLEVLVLELELMVEPEHHVVLDKDLVLGLRFRLRERLGARLRGRFVVDVEGLEIGRAALRLPQRISFP